MTSAILVNTRDLYSWKHELNTAKGVTYSYHLWIKHRGEHVTCTDQRVTYFLWTEEPYLDHKRPVAVWILDKPPLCIHRGTCNVHWTVDYTSLFEAIALKQAYKFLKLVLFKCCHSFPNHDPPLGKSWNLIKPSISCNGNILITTFKIKTLGCMPAQTFLQLTKEKDFLGDVQRHSSSCPASLNYFAPLPSELQLHLIILIEHPLFYMLRTSIQ